MGSKISRQIVDRIFFLKKRRTSTILAASIEEQYRSRHNVRVIVERNRRGRVRDHDMDVVNSRGRQGTLLVPGHHGPVVVQELAPVLDVTPLALEPVLGLGPALAGQSGHQLGEGLVGQCEGARLDQTGLERDDLVTCQGGIERVWYAGLATNLVDDGGLARLERDHGSEGGQEISFEVRGGSQISRSANVLKGLGDSHEPSNVVEWELVLAWGHRVVMEGLDGVAQVGDVGGLVPADLDISVSDLVVIFGTPEVGLAKLG